MKLQFRCYALLICTLALTIGVSCLAMANKISGDPFADPLEADALNRTDDNAPWIAKWLMLDGFISNTANNNPFTKICVYGVICHARYYTNVDRLGWDRHQ